MKNPVTINQWLLESSLKEALILPTNNPTYIAKNTSQNKG